ncbi:high-affinity iron transporter [Aeromonas sp. RU39B]|jgi:high-affinity iron transporter|uniref:FTR1 family iron permease n=1 Tax=Aeromonas sp. RU39B TaxID=1907416 RepID=UPI000953CBC4|nr:FTR1 family protein [Aeromonas sp. RU39B]SIQ02499.1 high-affinity iron transporter [Aeromonas sp. RU39B]
MFASFLITLREGLEAFLLVGICLSYLGKLGASRYNKFIYLGVVVGLLASLAVAFLFQVVVSQFESERYNHLLMAGILLFATLVLTYMAVWMQKQAKNQVGAMTARIDEAVGSGDVFGLAFLAFLAVMREGFETVLFFSALLYSGQGVDLSSGLAGALGGLLLAIVLVWLLLRSTRKVALAPFFRWTGLLIIVIAAGLLSSAVNMLQAAGIITFGTETVFNISHILDDQGVFGTFLRALFGYNASPAALQLSVWACYLLIFITLWHRGYRVRQPRT